MILREASPGFFFRALTGQPMAIEVEVRCNMSTSCQSTAVRYSPVMLSAAKHLAAHRARPFAALRVTSEGTRQILSEAKYDIGGRLRLG